MYALTVSVLWVCVYFVSVSGGEILEDAIKGDTSGAYRDALLLVLAGQSDEPQPMQLKSLSPDSINQLVNPGLAETDAKDIYSYGEGWVILAVKKKTLKRRSTVS